MHPSRVLASLLFLLSSLLWNSPARAVSVCISNVAGLTQALNAFDDQPDGSVLTIKLVQGTYAVGSALGQYHVAYPHSVGLQLLGGYTASCASRQVNPANTVIDGLNQAGAHLGFTFDDDAGALFEGLTFTRLTADSMSGSAFRIGLDVDTSDAATYEVRFCRFLHNAGTRLISITGPQMRFVNNLVAGNTLSGGGASAVYAQYSYDANSMLVATNNTIANNSGGAGLTADTASEQSGRITEVTDNILWGNGGSDLALASFNAINPLLVLSNVVGAVSGYTLPAGNLTANPQFVNAGADNYALASNSPAINSGSAFQMWGFPAHDLGGGPRITGSLIDRGAIESTLNDFTSAVVTTVSDNGSNSTPLAGSLRAAIKAANAAAGPFNISFNVAGGCPSLLVLASPMLDITGNVTIDGTTQAGWTPNDHFGVFDANLCLYVNGSGNASTPWALHVPSSAANSARLVVRGIGFAGFTDAAIKLEGGRNHRIAGSQFGAVAFTAPNHDAIRVTANSGGAFIGGYDDPAAVNLIAGSSDAGIYLDNTSGGSTVANNVIGFQADGVGDGGNGMGVYAFNAPANVIQYNEIGNSATTAVTLSGGTSSGNLVQYNTLGMDLNGGNAGNGGSGVMLSFGANNNTIGAPVNATYGGNFIFWSGGAGVWVSVSGGAGNRVLDNSFQGSGGIDIDLAQAGASANQASNPGSGANNLQNYPVLTTAARDLVAATETVTGTLISTPNTTHRLDIYYSSVCSSSAGGRGKAGLPLMKTVITTDALGAATFSATVPFGWGVASIGAISATVTDPAGNTSEIGNCVAETSSDTIFRNGFEPPGG